MKTKFTKKFINEAKIFFKKLKDLNEVEKIEVLNELRLLLNTYSPFKEEPVDCVQWIKSNFVQANDYNPNIVAPPEMKLLELSIFEDGYTQPIVAWKTENEHYEVVDGFHRNKVGKENIFINSRIKGYLPLSIINANRQDRTDRIASTIRHNRARGKHTVEGMSDIVVELKKRNWSNEKIAKELGMEQDEILRLCQITGLSELFADQEFSKSWDIEGFSEDFIPLSDDIETYGEEKDDFRVCSNTMNGDRIFHKWDKWECYKAGFYNNTKEGMTKQQCEEAYRDFLADTELFAETLKHIINEWKFSCEHYLTNRGMNRIAWLGQAAVCYARGIPSAFRGGFNLLSVPQQEKANETALKYLNKWLKANNRNEVTMEEAYGYERQVDLY